MKSATARRMGLFVPALALTFGAIGLNAATAQTEPVEKTTKAKTEKTRSKTVTGTFSQADATAAKIKGSSEEVSYVLVPTTVYWRLQRGVSPADLKVGETVSIDVPGTSQIGRVESLSPLTLKFDNATLTYEKTDHVKFERIAKITAADVVVGQKGKIAGNVYPDGRIEAREVWVYVVPEKKATPKK